MPELPEVETVKRGLESLIVTKQIVSVESDTPKSFPNSPSEVEEFLVGALITGIRRRAKVLLIDLSTGYTLVIHLKMTGQIVFVNKNVVDSRYHLPSTIEASELRFGAGHPNDSLIGELPDRSTRVTFAFQDGSHLYFNDQRKFGWVKLFPTVEVPHIDFMKKVGPEPLEIHFTADDFVARMRRRNRTTIKAALLDQTVIAGVGNIYADESLWAARIHPASRVEVVSDAKLKVLLRELRAVLELSIKKGGSTDRNYVNAKGEKGSYLSFANVFRKEGIPCQRCGDIIMKSRVAGRGTHTCPTCQREETL